MLEVNKNVNVIKWNLQRKIYCMYIQNLIEISISSLWQNLPFENGFNKLIIRIVYNANRDHNSNVQWTPVKSHIEEKWNYWFYGIIMN